MKTDDVKKKGLPMWTAIRIIKLARQWEKLFSEVANMIYIWDDRVALK